jgi:acetolactate synthase-1/2/3 large subunit
MGAGYLHEIPDQLGILERLTKWSAHIAHPAQAPLLVNEAFKHMHTGRPRPTALQIPVDIAAMDAEVSLLTPFADYERLQPDPDLIKQAAGILGKAKRPLIMVGGGALEAGPELLELAEALQAPVASHRQGKGIIDDRHYLSQTYPAGHRLWAHADVVLAVGTRLKYPLMYWGLDSDIQIIRIDIDPTELNRVTKPAVGIVADAKVAVADLINSLESRNSKRTSRKNELVALKCMMRKEYEKAVKPQLAILDVIREELPEDGYFVDEITQVGYVSWYGMPMYEPRHFISSGYQGNLGYGYATALGVQVAHPDKKVVAISGDGGFMYQVQELATAVQYKLNVIVIVFNDGAYGNVKRDQQNNFDGHMVGSELYNPDFIKLANSFGIAGYRALTPEQLRTALKDALQLRGPALIEMPVRDLPSPWNFIAMPRARQ